MKCEEREGRIALYVADDLSGSDAASIETHLATCARCRELADGLRRTARALESLGTEPAPGAAYREVRRRVQERLQGEDIRRSAVAPLWRWAVAAGLLLSLTLPFVFRERKPEPQASLVPIGPDPSVQAPLQAVASVPMVKRTPAGKAVSRRQTLARSVENTPKKATARGAEPMMVKLLTDDPDVVIYWLVDQNGG